MGTLPESSTINGGPIDRVVIVDSSGVESNTTVGGSVAPETVSIQGAVYNTTAPTYSNLDATQNQADASGNLKTTEATKMAGEDLTNDVMKIRDSATYTNLSASALIKTGAGVVKSIIINSHSSGTIKLWDNTSAATTVLLNTITLAAGERTIPLDSALEFSTGLYVTIGGTADITIGWK